MILKNSLYKKITLLFIISLLIMICTKTYMIHLGYDFLFLMIGNTFLFLLFILSVLVHTAATSSKNPHVFLRSIYLTMIIKMFASAIAIIIFVLLNNGEINKPALLTLMGLYILYTMIEVSSLMRSLRK